MQMCISCVGTAYAMKKSNSIHLHLMIVNDESAYLLVRLVSHISKNNLPKIELVHVVYIWTIFLL